MFRAGAGRADQGSTGRAVALVLAAVLVVALGVTRPAVASTGGRARTFAFHTHEDDIGGIIVPQSCSVNQTGICEFTYSGSTQWTGDFEGTSTFRGTAHFDPSIQKFVAEVWEDFRSVTVKGCGTGRMEFHGRALVGAEDQDPTTLTLMGSGSWRFVQGSGTGGLAGITDGAFDVNDINFSIPFLENHEDVDGTITCRSMI